MTTILNSVAKVVPSERTSNSNLTPEGKKRALSEVRRFVSGNGYINVSELSELFGLSHPTVRTLINEVLDKLREEE